jgi:hypothetical protein
MVFGGLRHAHSSRAVRYSARAVGELILIKRAILTRPRPQAGIGMMLTRFGSMP